MIPIDAHGLPLLNSRILYRACEPSVPLRLDIPLRYPIFVLARQRSPVSNILFPIPEAKVVVQSVLTRSRTHGLC